METVNTNRIEEIRAILSNVSFDITKDGNGFPEMVAFEHDTPEIFLECYMWFDGSRTKCFDLRINNEEVELTKEESKIIYVALCQQHKSAFELFEQEEEEDRYNDMMSRQDQETRDYISENFYSQY